MGALGSLEEKLEMLNVFFFNAAVDDIISLMLSNLLNRISANIKASIEPIALLHVQRTSVGYLRLKCTWFLLHLAFRMLKKICRVVAVK